MCRYRTSLLQVVLVLRMTLQTVIAWWPKPSSKVREFSITPDGRKLGLGLEMSKMTPSSLACSFRLLLSSSGPGLLFQGFPWHGASRLAHHLCEKSCDVLPIPVARHRQSLPMLQREGERPKAKYCRSPACTQRRKEALTSLCQTACTVVVQVCCM